MRDAVVWYLIITFGLLGLLTVVVVVQSLRDLARRVLRGRGRRPVDRRPAVEGWTSQPV